MLQGYKKIPLDRAKSLMTQPTGVTYSSDDALASQIFLKNAHSAYSWKSVVLWSMQCFVKNCISRLVTNTFYEFVRILSFKAFAML